MSMQNAPLIVNAQPQPMMQPMQPVVMGGAPPGMTNTTVVCAAPGTPAVVINDFQTGIFDCFSQLDVCCMSWWCPCCVYGQNERLLSTNGVDSSADMGQAAMCCCASCIGNAILAFIGCPGIVHAFFVCGQRKRFRQRANIVGGDCEDAVCSCFCFHCVLGQMFLEETRHKVLSKNPLGLAPVQQVMFGAPGPQVTVVSTNTQAPQPVYGQPMYAPPGQPYPAQPYPGQSYAGQPQPMYGQPMPAAGAPQPYYAAPPQAGGSMAPGSPPAYIQQPYAQPPQ